MSLKFSEDNDKSEKLVHTNINVLVSHLQTLLKELETNKSYTLGSIMSGTRHKVGWDEH